LNSKDGGAVTLLYNCDGDRVAKTVGGVTTQYLVDELNPTGYPQVLEEVVGGTVQTRYTYGTRLISQARGVSTTPTTSYYGYDAHGNITFLTDALGEVTDSYDYDAWGVLVASTGSTPNTHRYVGEELDPDFGLINLRARQYDPSNGRFRTIDPLTDVLDSRNRYLYANGDPVNRLDPLGKADAGEYAWTAEYGIKIANQWSYGLLSAVGYVTGAQSFVSGNKVEKSMLALISKTASTWANLTAIQLKMKGPQAPVGQFGVGTTVGCMMTLVALVAFGGNPGDLPPSSQVYPCTGWNPIPPVPIPL